MKALYIFLCALGVCIASKTTDVNLDQETRDISAMQQLKDILKITEDHTVFAGAQLELKALSDDIKNAEASLRINEHNLKETVRIFSSQKQSKEYLEYKTLIIVGFVGQFFNTLDIKNAISQASLHPIVRSVIDKESEYSYWAEKIKANKAEISKYKTKAHEIRALVPKVLEELKLEHARYSEEYAKADEQENAKIRAIAELCHRIYGGQAQDVSLNIQDIEAMLRGSGNLEDVQRHREQKAAITQKLDDLEKIINRYRYLFSEHFAVIPDPTDS